MKRFFTIPVLMFSFGILALLLSFASFSLANQGLRNEVANPGGGAVIDAIGRNSPDPSCVDNYRSWPASDRFRADAQWSLDQFPAYPIGDAIQAGIIRQFLDINGDGLQDYIYLNKVPVENVNQFEGCVLMNNGAGWTTAYKCLVNRDPERNNAWMFFGDCALVN